MAKAKLKWITAEERYIFHSQDGSFFVSLRSRAGKRLPPLKGKRQRTRLNESDAFGIMWRVVAPRARRGPRDKRKKRSTAPRRRGCKKRTLRKQPNRRGAAEIEKYRVKSAQTSILNCCRGAFCRRCRNHGCHSREARTNWTELQWIADWSVLPLTLLNDS